MKPITARGWVSLLAGFRGEVVHVALLSLATNLLMLVPTIYMLQLYDRVMVSRNELTLAAVTGMTCFLLLMMALAEWLRSTLVIQAGMRFDQAWSHRLFGLAFAPGSGTDQPDQPLNDLTAVRQFITGNGLFAFFDLPWSVLYVAVLMILSPVLGMVAVVFCAIQFGLALWNQRSTDDLLRQVMRAQSRGDAFLQGHLRQVETAHVMGMVPPLFRHWQALQADANALDMEAQQRLGRNQFVNKLVRYTMQSLMLAVAAYLVVQGKISVGSMIASNVLIARALHPFDVIVGTWRQYAQARESAGRLHGLHVAPALSAEHGARPDIAGHFSLRAVTVCLDEAGPPVLNHLDLDIRPGRILTMMGASGSGKTTLARTLVGLLRAGQGALHLDGVPLHEIAAAHLAAAVGYLPQEVGLIEGTIAANIARFGELDAHRIIAACQAVGLHETILRFPMGYETMLNALGEPLSGGQRQLIGIARAIYREPTILVLDEPNASLDESGEASLLKVLQQQRNQGKTIVVISHRTGLLRITDDLLILKNGSIAHYGPRDAGIAYLNQMQNLSMGSAA